MTHVIIRFDMRCPSHSVDAATLYQAALDQAQWADSNGFDIVQFSEHHGSDDGYLPSPIVLGAAIAARTSNLLLRFALITLPLHDPLRIAEDLAVLDIISQGRVHVVFGGGYAPHEFEMFGHQLSQRPQLMEDGISAIQQAWTGQPFDYRGRRVQITPTPLQRPGPEIWMGGSSPAAARRAARLCDGFYTAEQDLYQHYFDEAERLGKQPPPWWDIGFGFLHVTETPDACWDQLAPYICHELNSYAAWTAAATGTDFTPMDADTIRGLGLYPVLTPQQAIDYAAERGRDGNVTLHPLCGGTPPELGWASLKLFASAVLPTIRELDGST